MGTTIVIIYFLLNTGDNLARKSCDIQQLSNEHLSFVIKRHRVIVVFIFGREDLNQG